MKEFVRVKIFLICLVFLGGFPVFTCSSEISSETLSVAEKITWIRNNSIEYAGLLGLNPLAVQSVFPMSLYKIPFEISVVNPSVQVQQKAFSINTQIEKYDWDFSEYDDSSLKGFTSSVILFNNYMTPEKAVSIFIDEMFKKEIRPEFTGKRFILNLNYNLAGIDIKPGRSGNSNAYFITACFASAARTFNADTFNLINSVRNNPDLAHNYIYKYIPAAYSFPGYFLDTSNIDVQQPLFSGFLSASSALPETAVVYNESVRVYEYYNPLDQKGSIESAFSVYLLKELRDRVESPFIFSDAFNFGTFAFWLVGEIKDSGKYLASYNLEGGVFLPDEQFGSAIAGVYVLIYRDANNDLFFNPGEGFSDSSVYIEDLGTGVKTCFETDSSGRIQAWLPLGRAFSLSFECEGVHIEQTFNTQSGSNYLEVKL